MTTSRSASGFTRFAYAVGTVFLVLAIVGFCIEAWRLSVMREMAESMAKELPELRSSNMIIRGNIDSERLYGQIGKAALEEQATAYVLPVTLDRDRIDRMFRRAATVINEQHPIVYEELRFGASIASGTLMTIPSELVLSGSHRGVAMFVGALRWSGTFTVHDVVRDQAEAFLKKIQEDYPLGLPAAEEFLRTDLLTYASRPDQTEEDTFQDMPLSLAVDAKQMLLEAGLADVRSSLQSIASGLRTEQVWPLPLARIEDVRFEKNSTVVRLVFLTQPQTN